MSDVQDSVHILEQLLSDGTYKADLEKKTQEELINHITFLLSEYIKISRLLSQYLERKAQP